jgi:hypothetical protein
MVSRTKILTITVFNYIRKVKISNRVRPKYWEWDGTTIKCGSRKLLKRYINPKKKRDVIINNGNVLPEYLLDGFTIIGFNKNKVVSQMISSIYEYNYTSKKYDDIKYILCEETKPETFEKVIANPARVGLPNYEIINGQNIYNHTSNPFVTGKIFDTIKRMYYHKFKSIDKYALNSIREKLEKSYPIMIEMEIYDTVKSMFDNSKDNIGRRWDVGNRADPYMKTFLDFMVKGLDDIEPMIEEDDRLHVTSGNSSYFTPIDSTKDRKLVFHIYTDNRIIFKKYLNNE